MAPSNTHSRTATQGLRHAFLLQAASCLLSARARRRTADRVRARPRLEGLEDRCLMSVTITEYPVPTSSANLHLITAGPDGNLWFTEFSAGKIGEINPATHAITEYPVPYANTAPQGITVGPDGNLWFTDRGANAIGVVTLNPTSGTHLVVTQPPPASITAGSPFGLTVAVDDSSGNLVPSFDGTVTVGLASNPGGTTLGGKVVVAASGGVATFSGLTIPTVGSGYSIYVSASGPVSTTTNPFNVVSSTTSGAPAVMTTTTTPDPLVVPLILDSPDFWNGLGFKKRPRLA